MSVECLCVKRGSGSLQAHGGILRAKLSSAPAMVLATATAIGKVKANNSRSAGPSSSLSCVGILGVNPTVNYAPRQKVDGVGEIKSHASLKLAIRSKPTTSSSMGVSYTDKFAGDFNDYGCYHKLYPIKDLEINIGGDYFVDRTNNSGNLYESIDEGVFTGTYHVNGGVSNLIADDGLTYIHPSAIYTENTFRYKCEVTTPVVTAKHSRLFIRASAPMSNYDSELPPEYKIYNIKLEDPSGNLIIKYNDIILRGDSDYSDLDDRNYATYGTAPETNNLLLPHWHTDYPFMQEDSGYTLNLDFDIKCFDDPFDVGFDKGYDDTCRVYDSNADDDDYLALDGSPLSTQNQALFNPTNSLRISAIEICNSGAFNTLVENYVSFYVEVPPTGRRIERCFYPMSMPVYGFDTGIYPTVSSVWHDENSLFTNETSSGAGRLVNKLSDLLDTTHIILDSTSPVPDSGKLLLKFGHTKPDEVFAYVGGEFGIGIPITGAFDRAYTEKTNPVDNFFAVDSAFLKVRAKKDTGSRDYALDVVGYSDDKLLNVTSAVGGFLQNPSGDGSIPLTPLTSGYNPVNDLGISTEPISNKDQYYESSGTNNAGGDHYKLSSTVVNSTSFQWYEIPLEIYPDDVSIGKSPDYSISSRFEHLFMDIYPLPSGATIAAVQLCLKYKPANAVSLYTIGHDKIGRREDDIYPAVRQTSDGIINTGPDFAPLSKIEGIPHAFKTVDTLKSNYSRRWRGLEGTVQGPFDPEMFGFGFENPLLDFPFLSGVYDFDYDDGLTIKSRPLGTGFGTLTGTLSSTYTDHHFKNIGWRFNSNSLFDDQLPGYSGSYKTTDWTSLASGSKNFQDHELYGRVADAFNNVVRVSGNNSYINFGNIDTISGFSIYVRFTPDFSISGVDYNLYDSGVLFSKWDSGKELDFALGYNDGYLCGYAQDKDGNFVTVKDTLIYSGYQYPLSVVLTYNDHLSSGLKLYTDNELHDGEFTTLRASSSPFYKKEGTSDLVLGYSSGSGVGINAFVSEIGIATYHESGTNIVESSPDLTRKEITAQAFFEGNRVKFWSSDEPYTNDTYKLWNYVDEKTQDWDLGAFKYCAFDIAFDGFTQRSGRDLISLNMKHDGSGYTQRTDIQLPSSVQYQDIAYHTQIENDFLRFNLTDAEDGFYAVSPRITKDLPRGYKFSERAIVVETVLEHTTHDNIAWSDGNVGPKMIVSLYTKNQEPETYERENWGLINRAIHYLPPSGCIVRLDSVFDFESLVDESESWALFPKERYLTELNHKYYSQDIDDMFLQYDLVYPSGTSFESRIDIHTSHIRLDDSFAQVSYSSDDLNVYVSGEQRSREELNLFLSPLCRIDNLASGHPLCSGIDRGAYPSGLPLYFHAPLDFLDSSTSPTFSGMTLYTSGQILSSLDGGGVGGGAGGGGIIVGPSGVGSGGGGLLNLSIIARPHYAGSPGGGGGGGGVPGGPGGPGATYPGADGWDSGSGMLLYISGQVRLNETLPLLAYNTQESYIPGDIYLPLNLYASSGDGAFGFMPLSLYNRTYSLIRGSWDDAINLHSLGGKALHSDYADTKMSLSVESQHLPEETKLNLSMIGDEFSQIKTSESLNLHTSNYGNVGSHYLYWSNANYGHSIDTDDNVYTNVPADDEIRGIELICYGACDDASNAGKCTEKELYTHDTLWRPETCVDGGIFRALNTYTNLDYSYSGNYYGIRKYIGLSPGTAYSITMQGSTGTTNRLQLPREWEEWEYGSTDDINFSGVKFIADYPYLDGQKSLTAPSGRSSGDRYGYSVAAKNDLMIVGAPYHEFDEKGGTTIFDSGCDCLRWIGGGSGLYRAGALFAYRRNADVAGQKASWTLEDKIVLPSAIRADYYVEAPGKTSFGSDLPEIPIRKWQVGQEGREIGHSVDIAIDNSGTPSLYEDNKQIIVAGAPNSHWTRKFDDIVTSGVKVGVMVFTDEFKYDGDKGNSINDKIIETNFIYRYYSDPPVHLELKVIICQPTGIFGGGSPASNQQLADFIVHKKIGRNGVSSTAAILSGIKGAFHEAFPYDTSKTHNNIPPIFGMYADDSRSLGREDLEPAIDQFKTYYRDYSFESGVQDVYGVQDSGRLHEFIPTGGASENWVAMSKTIIDNLLDTGRLVESNSLRFITENVGVEFANPHASEFNVAPPSGGRVYIFEKEGGNGDWNLIQEIKSPNDLPLGGDDDSQEGLDEDRQYRGHQTPDRFGYAVAISDNAEVISVGSPYMEEACSIYEHNPKEKDRLYENVKPWMEYKNLAHEDGRYDLALYTYHTNKVQYGERIASEKAYVELSPSEKFDLRSDEIYWKRRKGIITEYKKIYKYDYSDISYLGTWQFIPELFAPTSRLGFSTTISDDGRIVAFGAPTDSFNEFDDTNIYYKGYDTWASYVNAGAVRVFESREYHSHSGVVEFFKFGNLDMNTAEKDCIQHKMPDGTVMDGPIHGDGQVCLEWQENSSYTDLKKVFQNSQIPFTRTDFVELEIPKHAGTAFIITPEIDAASDEVIDNIKNWMALGDRTLVLVGNDPLWEGDGKYQASNEIINKILEKLDSRMRLHHARTQYESLSGCAVDGRPNVVPAFVPELSRGTNIKTLPMYAKGVGDIRIHVPDFGTEKSPCDKTNGKCEMWLKHGGDLRAQWFTKCEGKRVPINWPQQFNAGLEGCGEEYGAQIEYPDEEPRPLLAAAEYLSEYTITYPAYDATVFTPIWKTRVIEKNLPNYRFAAEHVNNIEFIWSEATGNYTSVDIANFYDPPEYLDRNTLIQGIGAIKEGEPVPKLRQVDDLTRLSAEEEWVHSFIEDGVLVENKSKVVLIGCVTSENEENLTAGLDYNISFYENLVMTDCVTKGRILQIGGWTKRTSFEDAYSESLLQPLLHLKGNTVRENWTGNLHTTYNVCWIANPDGIPSEEEVDEIKEWLNSGDKTLVITYADRMPSDSPSHYDNHGWAPPDAAVARNVHSICERLGVNIKPRYLVGQERFATKGRDSRVPDTGRELNDDNLIIKGCGENHRVDKFSLGVKGQGFDFIPINIGNQDGYDVDNIVWHGQIIEDVYYEPTTPFWQIKTSIADLKVPVLGGSGYRIFYDWVSESPTEGSKLVMYVDDALESPYPIQGPPLEKQQLTDYDEDDNPYAFAKWIVRKELRPDGLTGSMLNGYVDVQIPEWVSGINIYFDGNNLRAGDTDKISYIPKTTRLMSVSGALLPIKESVYNYKRTITYIDGWEESVVHYPSRDVVISETFDQIQTDNTKYCRSSIEELCKGKGGKLIADGPVIAAEEPEHFSSFPAGYQRSKIVLLSDSSMIQGDCDFYRDVNGPNAKFIASLYDDTYGDTGPADTNVSVDIEEDARRQFRFTQKLLAPERGSPQKYFAASGIDGLKKRFAGSSYSVSPALTGFTDDESTYDPRFVTRAKEPKTEEAYKAAIRAFRTETIPGWGAFPKFSGVIGGEAYADVGPGGGMPHVMAKLGSDYLDFDRFPSGYPGDLFGFSISLHKNKLVVGVPFHGFTGEEVVDWDDIEVTSPVSGLKLSGNGGAGAAYYFERTGKASGVQGEYLAWENKQKIKPDSINTGLDDYDDLVGSQDLLGTNNYNSDDLLHKTLIGDQFGYDVSVDADFVAIGAPGHDFGTLHEHINDDGEFVRKEFNFEFDIPLHNFYDLGTSGARDQYPNSGVVVLNNGAVFTYEHRIVDWPTRLKKWTYAEKLIAQGYNSRKQRDYIGFGPTTVSGTEDDHFGRSVYLNRARRGDGDYTLAVGSPHHMFATSGNHDTSSQPLLDAGAAYTYDAMLREQPPSPGSPDNWITASVFGDTENDLPKVELTINQNPTGDSIEYEATGIVWTNNEGEIFLEASGVDPATKGFIENRSYIQLVYGNSIHGSPVIGQLNLHTDTEIPSASSILPLHAIGPASAKVYNSMDLYAKAAYPASGDMILYTSGNVPELGSGNLWLVTSGSDIISEQLNLRIRGK